MRWIMVLPRELVAGSTRFNDLRRDVPRMSPALLSQRLKDLEAADIAASASILLIGPFKGKLGRSVERAYKKTAAIYAAQDKRSNHKSTTCAILPYEDITTTDCFHVHFRIGHVRSK